MMVKFYWLINLIQYKTKEISMNWIIRIGIDGSGTNALIPL